LVCGTGWLVELSMGLTNFGALLGSVLCARMGDIYGRKPVLLACLWSNVILSTIQAFSPNFVFYCLLAFIDGMQIEVRKNISFFMDIQ